LDINPISEGHTLVIPKKHYETIDVVPDGEFGAIFGAVKKIVSKLRDKLEPDGFNVVQNNNPAAGQVIPHFHIHVIPRKEGDGCFSLNAGEPADSDQLDAILQKLED
jgi:histidine triad (HIT) family protein